MNSNSSLTSIFRANKADVVKNFAVIKNVSIKSFHCMLISTDKVLLASRWTSPFVDSDLHLT